MMDALVRLSIVSVVILSVAAVLPTAALAQRPRPSIRLIGAAGDCITGTLEAALTEPANTEELDEGWRIVVSLRGRPDLQNQGSRARRPFKTSSQPWTSFNCCPATRSRTPWTT